MFAKIFVEKMCRAAGLWRIVCRTCLAFLVILTVAAFFIDRGSDSYYVLILNYVILIPLFFASSYFVLKCGE